MCESDGDARFYSAVADALFDGQDVLRKPDVMFTHCGGKDRLAMVVRALREVDVPTGVAVDFDVLNAEYPLRQLVEAAGGDWVTVEPLWKLVKDAIDAKKPELSAAEVREEVTKVLKNVADAVSLKAAKEEIQKLFRRSSPWAIAKTVGKAFVPSGQPTQAYAELKTKLQDLGVFVVEDGEVESFVRGVGNHGPKWVNEVLKRDLKADAELEAARKYVRMLITDVTTGVKPRQQPTALVSGS